MDTSIDSNCYFENSNENGSIKNQEMHNDDLEIFKFDINNIKCQEEDKESLLLYKKVLDIIEASPLDEITFVKYNEFIDLDIVQQAIAIKIQANKYITAKLFESASQLYSIAIETNSNDAILYANRSLTNLRMEFYAQALTDATRAIEINPSYVKATYRKACAHIALGDIKKAITSLAYVVKVYPYDKDARARYTSCKKLQQQEAFRKALNVSDEKKTEIVDFIKVEDSYTGPKLIDRQITREFVLELVEYLRNENKLHKKFVYQIIDMATEYFSKQPSLIDITIEKDTVFTVCGDVHGQFYDLLNIFSKAGYPDDKHGFLFNGDFVDRGSFSVECILTLLTFKLLYPDSFFMARGNHETVNMNEMYGFFGEVKAKYSNEMVNLFTKLFNQMPLAHIIDEKITHGGLYDGDLYVNEIRTIDRKTQPRDGSVMCHLLWSDPQFFEGVSMSKRGVGIQFGPDITKKFLEMNNLDYMIRSHEVKQNGYEVLHDGKCITVFSAPNYCDSMGNLGAYIQLESGNLTPSYTSFEAVTHPTIKPMAYANSIGQYIMSMFK